MVPPAFRVFISVPFSRNLSSNHAQMKDWIFDTVQRQGFETQCFGESGIPQYMSWTFDTVQEIMSKCQGAIILGFPRWHCYEDINFATEWSHYEGALALSLKIPTLIIKDSDVANRGILYSGGGHHIEFLPPNVDTLWFENDPFKSSFNHWAKQVNSRYHVFFGYSSQAKNTAQSILLFLNKQNIKVKDWSMDFQSAGTILDEIQRAADESLGGIFLFTKDDELKSGDLSYAAPRDNVIYEAGFFTNSKGRERVLIIREEGAKMPADVGGAIYLSLKDRNDTSTIETQLMKFIQDRL